MRKFKMIREAMGLDDGGVRKQRRRSWICCWKAVGATNNGESGWQAGLVTDTTRKCQRLRN